jgi:D-lactate dehydrogenase
MRVAFFDAHRFERDVFDKDPGRSAHELIYFDARLGLETAELARSCRAICSFVNDNLGRAVLTRLKELGVELIALRSAGYNHVDLICAKELGLHVVRVPKYSPYAIAEHAIALALTLNRKIHRAHQRIRELNFSLDGLVGFDMHGKTAGVVGTGRIGTVMTEILVGFGCNVIAYDKFPSEALVERHGGKVRYAPLEFLLRESDVISLHVPLNGETRHMINESAFAQMKPSALLINTGRGGLIETSALISALKHHRIGGAGLDVYEEEAQVFFADHSESGIDDDVLARLLTFPNVVITSHQGFLTNEALENIARTTIDNLSKFEQRQTLQNRVEAT